MVLIKLERKHVLQKDFEEGVNYFSPCSAKPFCAIHFWEVALLKCHSKCMDTQGAITAITYELAFSLNHTLVSTSKNVFHLTKFLTFGV